MASFTEELFSITGKNAVVTGGARGIGAMLVQALTSAGANVFAVARSADPKSKLASEIRGPGKATFLPCDLTSKDGVKSMASQISKQTDKIHILVNNAGTFMTSPLADSTEENWDAAMAINLRTPFFVTQALLPLLQAASKPGDPARVINIGSIAGLWGNSSGGGYVYNAAKAGVHHLTKSLASDYTSAGINVNAIAPGFFPTDMTDGFFSAVPGLKEQTIDAIPAKRLGTPEDIAGTVMFLSSRAGAYVAGTVIPVEGGLWAK